VEKKAMSSLVQSFTQREKLTKRLNSILKEYPNGTQIFRELLQNADDASATQFRILLDERSITSTSQEQLVDTSLLQGVSLICTNNAKFEDRDFESIQSLGNSRKESERNKTGRFGIGFNSAYHLTDYPQIVSGNVFGMFDPNEHVSSA
jgi:sacsin